MDLQLRRNQAFSYDDGTDALIDRSIVRANVQGTRIGKNAFRGCTQLKSVNAPNATVIGGYAFHSCSALTEIELPNVTHVETDGIFSYCTNLINLRLPKLKTADNQANGLVSQCYKLPIVVLPSYTGKFGTTTFNNCNSLQIIDVNSLSSINYNCFSGCTVFNAFIIRDATKVPTLSNISAFNNTPFASGGTGGTIYIPKVLYDHLEDGTSLDYLSNANWNTVNGYGTITWASIEGSQYEHYYADGTPIPTS